MLTHTDPCTACAPRLTTQLACRADIVVVAWRDGCAGHDPASDYAERFWLPVVGPTTFLAARRLLDTLGGDEGPVTVALEPLARSLGLGPGTGSGSAVVRSLARLFRFDLADFDAAAHRLAVRTRWPWVPERYLRRFPDWLRAAHAHTHSVSPTRPPSPRREP